MLTVSDLSVRIGSRTILNNISLEIPRGSLLGLIGPNGSGKTTLIRAISGILPAQSGRIEVDGQDLAALSIQARAQQIAVVQQARSLPPAFTAWDTVLLGRTPHLNWLGQVSPLDETRARQAMQSTGTLSLADRRVGELSGGEQQRLLIARALAQSTPILLLDEPTSHLDLAYQVSLLELIRRLAREEALSVLLVMHDLNQAGHYADRIGLLVQGELQALGSPAEILDPELLSQAYHVPLRRIPGAHPGDHLIFPDIASNP